MGSRCPRRAQRGRCNGDAAQEAQVSMTRTQAQQLRRDRERIARLYPEVAKLAAMLAAALGRAVVREGR